MYFKEFKIEINANPGLSTIIKVLSATSISKSFLTKRTEAFVPFKNLTYVESLTYAICPVFPFSKSHTPLMTELGFPNIVPLTIDAIFLRIGVRRYYLHVATSESDQ